MSIRQLTAELSAELAAARRRGYVELETVVTMPKYNWAKHPLRWLMHRLFNGVVIQTQIMVPTRLLEQAKAAKPEENET